MSTLETPHTNSSCRICATRDDHALYFTREMMFGSGETFRYFQCVNCETLQIETIPPDLTAYYPPELYYSHKASAPRTGAFARARNGYAVTGKGLAGALLYAVIPAPELSHFQNIHLSRDSRILDIGCGSAATVLRVLDGLGFHRLLGADPFLSGEIRCSEHLQLLKRHLSELSPEWDVIRLNSVLEHVPDPHETMQQLRRLLAPNGTIMLRLPTVSSFAWRKYGTNWSQLDAPRHLHLFSVRSLQLLVAAHGFEIRKKYYDSSGLGIWGSEQIARGVPLHGNTPPEDQVRQGRREAARLDALQDGDTLQVYVGRKFAINNGPAAI